MDTVSIQQSREHFERMRQDGIIITDNYDSKQWLMTDEVQKSAVIDFGIDEVHFQREVSTKLACTLSDYNQAMRIVITARFGYAIRTLQTDAVTMRTFANHLLVPEDYAQAQVLSDLLTLLPGTSPYREELQCKIDDISPLQKSHGQQRSLAHYQSYLRFSDLLTDFWKTASSREKTLYFPIWFWFSVTGVLPLRPTECVLTPRQCITQIDDKYYLEIRRTGKKGTRQDVRYRIDLDYERHKYPIPKHLAIPILEYITATQNVYDSNIDVLFCKHAQFSFANIVTDNDNHYTYANLKQCLNYFYRDVVQDKYKYTVVRECDTLIPGEIQRINLGDMRHIAMVSLALTGGSPSICKELAGHDSIEISSHYYSNLTSFLDLLGWERYRCIKSTPQKAHGLTISQQYPVSNGYCQCEQVWHGDYSSCTNAVDSNGMPGSCPVCKWYFPSKYRRNGQITMRKEQISHELEQTCILMRQAIDQVRKGLGNADTISCVLDNLSAQSRQYIHLSALDRLCQESED